VDCEPVTDANVRLPGEGTRTSRELPDVASRGDFKHQPVVPSDVGVDAETAVRILDAIETDEDEVRMALLGKCAVIRQIETAMAIAVTQPALLTTVFRRVRFEIRGIMVAGC
jgi:hypothetical protein